MPAPPPTSPDAAAVEIHRADGDPRVVVICDHASNARPEALGDLGLPSTDLERHIAYDIGARGVAWALAEMLGCAFVASTFSRLAIDPNRGEDDPTVLMRLYDRTIIPGNAAADASERERRLATLHWPYHDALERTLVSAEARAGRPPLIVSVHSFTPQLRGRAPRPWHVGVLWKHDPDAARLLLDRLGDEPDLVVGDNEPYAGSLDGDTLWRHGARVGRREALIEVRQDLIAEDAGQRAWADRLGPHLAALRDALAPVGRPQTRPGTGAVTA